MIFVVLGNNDCSYYMHCSKSLTREEILFFFFFLSFFFPFSLKEEKTVNIVEDEGGPWKKPGSPDSVREPTAQCSWGQLTHSYCRCLRRREERGLVSRGKV